MRILIALLLSVSVFGEVITTNTPGEYFDTVNNNVARLITAKVTVGAAGVTIAAGAPTVPASVVSQLTGVADISATTAIVVKTFAEIQAAKGISVPITLQAVGNTTATPASSSSGPTKPT